MKKLVLLVLGILVVGLVGVGVVADENDTNGNETCTDTCSSLEYECGNWTICDEEVDCGICTSGDCVEGSCIEMSVCNSDNLDLCTGNSKCTDAGGFWYNGACNEEAQEEEDEEENGEGNQGLGQIIRGRVKAGVYTSPTGEQIRVRELAQNRFLLQVNNVSADCECELKEETENNKTKLKAKLSNGRNAEIKVMPNVASEKALERLRLKACSTENNCSIELKEVGKGTERRLAYELQAQRHARLLGMFRAKMQVKSQVDAETGEIIRVKKPWWAFLASEPEE